MGTLEDKRRAVDEGTYRQNWMSGQEFVDTHPGALEAIRYFNSGQSERDEQARYMAEYKNRLYIFYRDWAYANRLALSVAGLTGIVVSLTLNEPDKYSQVVGVFGETTSSIMSGFGEILKGIGEVIPG